MGPSFYGSTLRKSALNAENELQKHNSNVYLGLRRKLVASWPLSLILDLKTSCN